MFCLTVIPLLLIPAAYRWWDGRRLRARPDDAALAERWMAHVGRSTRVTLVCMLMVPMLCPEWGIPGMLGVVLISRAAAYPARRALLGETWSLLAYLEWSVRLFIAWAGFWTLLAWTPYLIEAAGRHWLLADCTLAVALGAWQRWFPQVLLCTLRARPLDPESIGSDFAEGVRRVLQRSHAATPRLWRAGPTVGVIANALALPSLGGSSVLFSETLLESLSPSETAAIFAHEVAHLEHYDRRRLRRLMAGTVVLVAGAIASAPLIATLAPGREWIAITGWPVAVVVAMALRARHSQQHETASDRRAIELCGDPDALASALVKLHTLARIPRRWSPDMEQRASHPSLARRLRDIRALSDGPPAPATAPVIVAGADTGVFVVIEADRVRHLSGVPDGVGADVAALVAAAANAVSLPYEDVADLRVVSKRHRCELHITSHDGRRLLCGLREADVQRVQAALDEVDRKIPTQATALSDPLIRVVVILCALAAMLAGIVGHGVSLVGVVWISAIRMTPASLAGLAAGSLAAALMFLTSGTGSTSLLAAGAAGLVGAILIWRAWKWGQLPGAPTEPRWRAVLLGIGVLCAWVVVIWPSTNLLMLHRLVRELPAVVILPAALAGTLWMATPRKRWSGAIATLLAIAPLLISPTWVAYRIIDDPFLQPASTFASRTVQLAPLAAVAVADNVSSLQLSRDGTRFVVAVDEYDDEGWGRDDHRFLLGDFAGHQKEIVAVGAAFIDDTHLMVLSQTGNGLMLRLSSENGEEPAWQTVLDIPGAADLDADTASGRWRVSSRTADRLFSIEGTRTTVATRQEWAIPTALRARQWISTGTGDAFGWGIDSQQRRFTAWPFLQMANVSGVPVWTARFDVLSSVGARMLGQTLQEAQCHAGPPGVAVSCFLTDGETTRVWRLGRERLDFVGSVDGKFEPASGGSPARFTGWVATQAALIDLDRREIGWLMPPGAGFAYDWDVASGVIGAIVDDGDMMQVATYRYR
jgi:heat shock protein HtpX